MPSAVLIPHKKLGNRERCMNIIKLFIIPSLYIFSLLDPFPLSSCHCVISSMLCVSYSSRISYVPCFFSQFSFVASCLVHFYHSFVIVMHHLPFYDSSFLFHVYRLSFHVHSLFPSASLHFPFPVHRFFLSQYRSFPLVVGKTAITRKNVGERENEKETRNDKSLNWRQRIPP